MGLINNIVGLFVGDSSKKRQIAVLLGLVVMALQVFGVIDWEMAKVAYGVIGVAFGFAVSSKLTKMHKTLLK